MKQLCRFGIWSNTNRSPAEKLVLFTNIIILLTILYHFTIVAQYFCKFVRKKMYVFCLFNSRAAVSVCRGRNPSAISALSCVASFSTHTRRWRFSPPGTVVSNVLEQTLPKKSLPTPRLSLGGLENFFKILLKRLDQGHLHPKLEVPGLTCPGRQ